MMGMSRVGRYAFISSIGKLSRFRVCGSGSGSGSGYSPFSTAKRKAAARKVDEPPKPKKTYIIDDFVDEMRDINKDILNPTLASPLVQVFSVSIDTNFDDDERPCELYGSIRATEGTNATYSLYDRNHDSPETILKHGNLSLIGPQSMDDISCSVGTTRTRIELSLKEKTRNIEFMKSHLILDSNTEEIENSYDKLKTAILGAENGYGFARVKYATFRHAVFACVETAIFAKYDVSRPVSKVYGSIFAGYANSKSYHCCKDDTLSSMKCTLFNRPPDRPERAAVGTPLSLSRCVVAVPVHSSLKIEAHLWDHNHSHNSGHPFASGFVEFLVCPNSFHKGWSPNSCNKLIHGEGGSVVVSVTWDNALRRVYTAEEEEEEERRREEDYTCTQLIDDDTMHMDKPPLILQNNSPPSSTRALELRTIYGSELVEVFSVFVDSKANEVPALCGWVHFDTFPQCRIFEHDISDPDFCSAEKRMISLEGHSTIDYCNHFGFRLHLKDPISEVEISVGVRCNASIHPLESPYEFPWYDKRMCYVIQGAHGYAVMHHIVLLNACSASIEMTIIFDADGADDVDPINARSLSSANIYGCVFARYKSHDYSSIYAKKYYQSKLFDKSESESVELTTQSSKLPLLKSVVSVPIDDSLIVEANLYDNPKQKAVFGTAEFEVGGSCCTIHKRIHGHRFCILICVQLAAC